MNNSVRLFLTLSLLCCRITWAGSAACNQAQAIVNEVKQLRALGNSDQALALAKLSTARDLCPTLGEAWKYSYCSAQALGDTNRARIYKERAIFNGVTIVECNDGTSVPEPLPSFVSNKYALLVGIDRFFDSTIPTLHFAAKDATDLQTLLIDPNYGRFSPENVTLLTNEAATRLNILKALNEIALKAQENDLVLLFFSSHGSPRLDHSGLQGIGFIITTDTDWEARFINSLAFEDLEKNVGLIAARRKIVILDTCYSGQAKGKGIELGGTGIEAKTAAMFLSGEGVFVITSSSENEVSYESEKLHNGYFTYFLLKALQTWAGTAHNPTSLCKPERRREKGSRRGKATAAESQDLPRRRAR